MEIERRITDASVEVRADHAGNKVIEGYASVFDSRSQNLGYFVERVRPGAFAGSIANDDDVRALLNHDPNFVLGRRSAGTLEVSEDSTGLHYRITPSNASYARDLVIAMERGDVSQSSFGFMVNPDGEEWGFTDDDFPLRSLTSVRLVDVSPVTFPAYLDTASQVAVRAIDQARGMSAVPQVPDSSTSDSVRAEFLANYRALYGRRYI